MALAPTAAGIDDIAVKLSQEQESILDRLRHELDSIAIESNTKKDQNKKGPGRQRTRYLSAALLSTTPWTALSRTKMLTSGREGEMPDDALANQQYNWKTGLRIYLPVSDLLKTAGGKFENEHRFSAKSVEPSLGRVANRAGLK
jgi:hypothetical protein